MASSWETIFVNGHPANCLAPSLSTPNNYALSADVNADNGSINLAPPNGILSTCKTVVRSRLIDVPLITTLSNLLNRLASTN